MLISTMSGQENNSIGFVKYHQFIVPSAQFPIEKERFIWEIARGVDPKLTIRVAGRTSETPAAYGMSTEMTGKWLSTSYDVPPGIVLKLFCFKKAGASPTPVSGVVFIRMRDGAPLQRVSAILTGWERSTITRAAVEGRFDILSARDIRQLGVAYTALTDRQMDPQVVERCFEITVMAASSGAKEIHQVEAAVGDDGRITQVETKRDGRALDL